MGRCLGVSGILAGILAIGAAVVFLILFLSDTELSKNFIEDTFCNEDETLIREEHQTTSSDGGNGTSITFYCSNNNTGEEREITGQAVMVAIAGFGIPLCFGILIVIGSAGLITRSVANQAIGQYTNLAGQPPSNLKVTFTQQSYTAEEVEERLRQLQEMLNAGTLSQEQYFTIEQELRNRQQY